MFSFLTYKYCHQFGLKKKKKKHFNIYEKDFVYFERQLQMINGYLNSSFVVGIDGDFCWKRVWDIENK